MKIGFIGCGNMAKAMIGGLISVLDPKEIIASDAYLKGLESAKAEFGINISLDNKEVASVSEVVVLAVKPHFYEEVIREIAPVVNKNTIIVAIAPGKTLDKLAFMFGKSVKIIRTMPNTPCLVLEGVVGMCKNEFVTDEELLKVSTLFDSFAKTAVVSEYMMDAVVAVSGSSPAYVFMFIEALADGAVLEGLPRNLAYEFAAQAVLGSAKMVLETKKHPGELKDMVCSPGGTTIEAVKSLEESGFKGAIMKAMHECAKKSRLM